MVPALLVLLGVGLGAVQGVDPKEYAALVALNDVTGGPQWSSDSGDEGLGAPAALHMHTLPLPSLTWAVHVRHIPTRAMWASCTAVCWGWAGGVIMGREGAGGCDAARDCGSAGGLRLLLGPAVCCQAGETT
jgi:hypothetical protein